MNDPSASSFLESESPVEETIVSSESESSEAVELAKRETKTVRTLRGILIFVLVAAATGVSLAVYRFTSSQEQKSFEDAFLAHGSKVTEALSLNVEKQLHLMDTFAISLTAYAKDQNNAWPFVTVPAFERMAHSVLPQIQGLSLVYLPIVTDEERKQWEQYAQENFHRWANESIAFQESGGYDVKYHHPEDAGRDLQVADEDELDFSSGISSHIYAYNSTGGKIKAPRAQYYAPIWHNAPFLSGQDIENREMTARAYNKAGIEVAYTEMKATLGQTINQEEPDSQNAGLMNAITGLVRRWGHEDAEVGKDPVGNILYPVIDTYNGEPHTVGVLQMYLYWRGLFLNILSTGVLDAVFFSTCSDAFTYRIDGPNVHYLSPGDAHDPKYSNLEQSIFVVDGFNNKLTEGTQYAGAVLSDKLCEYTLSVYPTDALRDKYVTNAPIFYTVGVIIIFLFAGFIFATYDYTVEKRQRLVLMNALKTNAIVSSLFPQAIADRMIKEQEDNAAKKAGYMSNKQRLKTFLNDGKETAADQAIADLFPETTVMMADIVSFSSWASARDPTQVFTLLQTIYQAFDQIAKRRHVFKVETVGDSYVAVCGLPEKQPDHFLRMAYFSLECCTKVNVLTKELEVKLGPDTGDLKMRFGLHSGPCIAGVLRGEKARFQLFGDTINMASRMENTSLPNRVQISKATANLLMDAGKAFMLEKRAEEVFIKGKGRLETYFLVNPKENSTVSSSALSVANVQRKPKELRMKEQRLVDWNCKILSDHLKKVVARRVAVKGKMYSRKKDLQFTSADRGGKSCLEELDDVLSIPQFDEKIMTKGADFAKEVELPPEVLSQLKLFVETIASKYLSNPFHNFEHASHVSMSVDKLLNRIVTPDIETANEDAAAKDLHHYTHGITSDPLIHFGVVLSALVHDVDHKGISNMQLAKEDLQMAERYKYKSIAEQNSVDIALDLLMQPELRDLRACIFSDEDELQRFRQTVMKVVLATDIFDKELNDLRKARWEKAFAKKNASEMGTDDDQADTSVKATIVIEHLIQASDVSHTMQHWHIYRKWNERLFHELTKAYQSGRMGKDPAEFWYHGELGFFDNYIIPLTRKLKDCGVFGVSSDEYLSYALANREEWEQKGQDIVAEMAIKYRKDVKEDSMEGTA